MRALSLILLACVVLSSGCAQRELRDGEQREYYVTSQPACQTARDARGKLIPGTIVCNPRRAPIIGSRIVRNSKPTKTE